MSSSNSTSRHSIMNQSVMSLNIALMDLVNKFSVAQEQNKVYLKSLNPGRAEKFLKKFYEDPEIQRRLQSFSIAQSPVSFMFDHPQIVLEKSPSTKSEKAVIAHSEDSLFKKRRLNPVSESIQFETISEASTESETSDFLGHHDAPIKSASVPKKYEYKFCKNGVTKSSKHTKSDSTGDVKSELVLKTLNNSGSFKLFKKSTSY